VRIGSRAIATAASSLLLSALACAPALAAGGTYPNVSTGTLSRSAAPALAAPLASGSAPARGARRTGRRIIGSSSLARAPVAAPSALAQPASSLLANFNGVSSRDSAITNFGAEFEPPDQGLCAGNGYVVEMINSAYSVYDTAGKVLAGPFNVNGPFNEGLTEFTSDPRCYYDTATGTWFATILQINREETASNVDIAVNISGDPRTAWTVYRINTTGLGGQTGPKDPGCPCFGDQPTLGIDRNNLYVTTNEFSLKGPNFNGAQVYAVAKKQLATLSPSVNYAHFAKLNIGGAAAASIQPALTTGGPAAEYFLSSIDPTETFDQRIGVWALTEGALVASGGVPKLSSQVLNSEAFGVPPKGEQKGASSLIDAGDDRMQQVQFIGSSIWGELDTALNIPGDASQRAGAAWFQVKATLSEGTLASARLQRQGYVAVPGNYVLYPALQATKSGSVAMVMSITGAKRHPSAAYSVMAPEASSFGPVTVAAAGTGAYDPEATRWGDYSFAVLDTSLQSAWLATEYVPPKSSQTPDGQHNWGTRVMSLTP
jgi:hypothetical protein